MVWFWVERSGLGSTLMCLQHNSKTNDTKVVKLGIGNDLGIYYNNNINNNNKQTFQNAKLTEKVTWFWVERSKVNVRVNSNTAWVRTL